MSDRAATDGSRSPAGCVELAAGLHERLATVRMAWEATLLRCDAALVAGDEVAAEAALDDHRRLLAAVEDAVERAVVQAVTARSSP